MISVEPLSEKGMKYALNGNPALGKRSESIPGHAAFLAATQILAVEPKTHSFVVIELKKGRPSDQVIGQVLRYMGWVKKNLCAGGNQ